MLVRAERRRADEIDGLDRRLGTEHLDKPLEKGRELVRDRGCGHHAVCTTRPLATVVTTAPRSFRPSSHEFAERERKPLSVTVHSRSRSSWTRFARAPTS